MVLGQVYRIKGKRGDSAAPAENFSWRNDPECDLFRRAPCPTLRARVERVARQKISRFWAFLEEKFSAGAAGEKALQIEILREQDAAWLV